MFRRYSGKGNASPGVLIVATSVPVLGVSPGTGATGAAVLGAGSRSLSVGGGFGAGVGVVLAGFGGFGATGAGLSFSGGAGFGGVGAGFSSGGGVGSASRASRFVVVGAGAATRSTAYDGGDARVGFTAVIRKRTPAA